MHSETSHAPSPREEPSNTITLEVQLSSESSETDTMDRFKSNQEQQVLLKHSSKRHYFLSKMGIVSFIYWGFLFLVLFLMNIYMNDFRRYYWLYRLNLLFYVYLMIFIILKISFSFTGHILRGLQNFFFFLDLFVSYFVIVGLFFTLNMYIQNMYTYNGHYLYLLVYAIFFNTLAFIASTIMKRNNAYHWMAGFILMEASSYAVIFYFENYVPNLSMSTTRYLVCFVLLTIVNFYIAFDSYLMLQYRGDKFYENDSIFAFFCLWTDWFSYFWIDLGKFANENQAQSINKQYGSRVEKLAHNREELEDS